MGSPHIQSNSFLIEEGWLHHSVRPGNRVVCAPDSNGLAELYSVGTNGHVYSLAPDPQSDTGWRQDDLNCPVPSPQVIAALCDSKKRSVVGVAEQSSRRVAIGIRAAAGQPWVWSVLVPSAHVGKNNRFHQMVLRETPDGGIEFFLMFVQRTDDIDWKYRYRIGRASTGAVSWSYAYSSAESHRGSWPVHMPIALGNWNGAPALFIYYNEKKTLLAWRNLDGPPLVEPIAWLPGPNDYLSSLSASAPGSPSALIAAGSVATSGGVGVFEFTYPAREFRRLPGNCAPIHCALNNSSDGGQQLFAYDAARQLYHAARNPGEDWIPFQPLGEKVEHVTGCFAPGEGSFFGTVDSTGRTERYLRNPERSDWQRGLVATMGTGVERIEAYGSSLMVVDSNGTMLNSLPMKIWTRNTAEVLIDGTMQIMGPDRPFETTSGIGKLNTKQSVYDTRSLTVEDLYFWVQGMPEGHYEMVAPSRRTQDKLYALTGDELKKAHGRNPNDKVLPDNKHADAARFAESIADGMSLGRKVRDSARIPHLLTTAQVQNFVPGRVYFIPAGSQEAQLLDFDLGDLWQQIQNGFYSIVKVIIDPILKFGSDLVESIKFQLEVAGGVIVAVLKEIQHAFDAVASFFTWLGSKFETVVEWLSYLFNWENVKKQQEKAKAFIREGLGAIPKVIKHVELRARVKEMLETVRANTAGALQSMIERWGGGSIGQQSRDGGYTNSDDFFSFGGDNYAVPANWLMDKLMYFLPQMKLDASITNSRGWNSIDNFTRTIGGGFSGLFQSFFADLERFFSELGSDIALFEQKGGDFLRRIAVLAVEFIDLLITSVEEMIDGVLELIEESAILKVLESPIHIPFLGDILQLFGLEPDAADFTIIDMLSLIAAIPMHIIDSFSRIGMEASSDKRALFIAAGSAFVVCGLYFMAVDAVPTGFPAAIPILNASIIIGLVSFYFIYAGMEPASIQVEPTIANVFILVVQVAGIVLGIRSLKNPESKEANTKIHGGINVALGVINNILYIVFEARNCSGVACGSGACPTVARMVANHMATLPPLTRVIKCIYPDAATIPWQLRAVMVASQGLCFGSLAAASFVDAGVTPASPAQT